MDRWPIIYAFVSQARCPRYVAAKLIKHLSGHEEPVSNEVHKCVATLQAAFCLSM
jgi:hypothetical protein